MLVASFAFQACSIDHSDISPFRINHLRAVQNSVAQNPPSNTALRELICLQPFAGTRRPIVSGIVSDLLMSPDHLR
jgi:hypothetical protein